MQYEYGFEYAFPDGVEGAAEGIFVGAAGILTGILIIFYLLMLAFSVVAYVLNAVGMYRIAKRRGIHHAWLAWIPVGDAWLLGSISDHYQYVAKQKTTKRRKVLLILSVILFAVCILFGGAVAALVIAETTGAGMGGSILSVALMVISYLAILGLAIASTVFCYIAYFDLFRSCRPEHDVLFLVLGIIFPVTLPFFVFGCSSSDKGMPARRPPQQPSVQIPYTQDEPVQVQVEEEPAQEEIPVVEAEIVEDPEE